VRIAAAPADETMASARDEHLDGIRALMAAHSPPLHGLVVPSEDAHQVRAAPRPRADRGWIGSPVGVRWASVRVLFYRFVLRIDPGCGLFVQSEYVSEQDKRREFISGFTGSAGPC
jgi:Xaa-Pro aminopeptidase